MHERLKRWVDRYKALALMTFNTLLILFLFFSLTNAFLGGLFWAWDSYFKNNNPVSRKYGEALVTAYPGWTTPEIKRMLRENSDSPFVYAPFTQFREGSVEGQYVHVSKEGIRAISAHAPWPPTPQKINIFVFGGSTTFGKGLPDGDTIPAQLQDLFQQDRTWRDRIAVYNLGQANYYSSQERVFFEKLLAAGIRPQVAVFIDGLNEFFYLKDEPSFTRQLAAYMNGSHWQAVGLIVERWLRDQPIGRFFDSFGKGFMAYLFHKQTVIPRTQPLQENDVRTILDRYRANKQLIDSAGKAFHLETLMVWQPVPFYHYDPLYYAFNAQAYDRSTEFAYPLAADWLAKDRQSPQFLWLADIQQHLHEPLYVDQVHYRATFCRRIASEIKRRLIQNRSLLERNP
jgi:hypothetical protein